MVASGPSSWGTRARRASRSGPSRVWVTVGMWAPGGFAGLAGGLGEGGGGQVDHTDRVDLHGSVERGVGHEGEVRVDGSQESAQRDAQPGRAADRQSTRLNYSH